jgi:hypothetical protein
MLTALAFIILAVVHFLPIAPAFSPDALLRLYGVAPDDTSLLVLLRHRAVLLAIVGVLCVWAAVSSSARRAALTAAALNVVSFLAFYALYASPPGPLRTIALVDAFALIPLAFTAWATFARP